MSYGMSGGGDDLRYTISMTGVLIIGRHSHRTAIYPTAEKEQALSACSAGNNGSLGRELPSPGFIRDDLDLTPK